MERYRAEAPEKGGAVDWKAFAEEKWGTLVKSWTRNRKL